MHQIINELLVKKYFSSAKVMGLCPLHFNYIVFSTEDYNTIQQ